jgi:hypothetical protein
MRWPDLAHYDSLYQEEFTSMKSAISTGAVFAVLSLGPVLAAAPLYPLKFCAAGCDRRMAEV